MKTVSNRKNRSGLYIVLTALFVLTFFAMITTTAFASTKAGVTCIVKFVGGEAENKHNLWIDVDPAIFSIARIDDVLRVLVDRNVRQRTDLTALFSAQGTSTVKIICPLVDGELIITINR